ncbi:MAG: UDP-N-acetylglucosamine 2-epimerase (non-hydrolyzing) [Oleiphilaceae bacterium]|nr:UDP-N-acetylglucosamine 2-epimerase (non-hydrolyzing) [Oleiphilaceae bacterium]
MKVVTVLGARPQFIKAGTVSRELAKQKESGKNVDEVIVHTGQHYDANMSDIFFEEMKIPKPDYMLGVGCRTHGAMTGQMLEKIENVLVEEKPDVVMVYGDTNSTLAGALAASKLHIPIAHVEAGLRSFNMNMPEEVNRILTDRVSKWLFCPTETAVKNLHSESVENWKNDAEVHNVGDVMLDGALFYKDLAVKPNNVPDGAFILCTIHRAENTDSKERMTNIIGALNEIAHDQNVVLPLHPRTRKIIAEYGLGLDEVKVIDPVGYLNMVWLVSNCDKVMTDSGGLQKEAYFFSKPCITLRDETEWVELVSAGANKLVGANRNSIVSSINGIGSYRCSSHGLYGDGSAAEKIITCIGGRCR